MSLCTDKETGKQLERGKQILNLHSSNYKYIYNIRIYTHASYIYVYIYNTYNTYESFTDSRAYTSYTSMYMHEKNKEKERLNLKNNREGYIGGLKERQGKWECCNYNFKKRNN